jgi:hypothetical protein
MAVSVAAEVKRPSAQRWEGSEGLNAEFALPMIYSSEKLLLRFDEHEEE